MKQIKYGALISITPTARHELAGVDRPAIRVVADAYSTNVERIGAIILSTPFTMMWTRLHARAVARACTTVFGGPERPRGFAKDNAAEDKLAAEFDKELKTLSEDGARESDENTWADLMQTLETVDHMYEQGTQISRDGLAAIVSNIPVAAWTAIETMAGDLWEAALNIGGRGLWELAGRPKRISKLAMRPQSESVSTTQEPADERAGERRRDTGRSVPMAAIRRVTRGTMDLRAAVGTLLRDEMSFSRLESIREAYSIAFRYDSSSVDEALADKSLDALALTRNIIVHRGGRADREYVERSARLPAAPPANLGEPVHFDGEAVASIVAPAINAGTRLILAVDQWAQRHGRHA